MSFLMSAGDSHAHQFRYVPLKQKEAPPVEPIKEEEIPKQFLEETPWQRRIKVYELGLLEERFGTEPPPKIILQTDSAQPVIVPRPPKILVPVAPIIPTPVPATREFKLEDLLRRIRERQSNASA